MAWLCMLCIHSICQEGQGVPLPRWLHKTAIIKSLVENDLWSLDVMNATHGLTGLYQTCISAMLRLDMPCSVFFVCQEGQGVQLASWLHNDRNIYSRAHEPF